MKHFCFIYSVLYMIILKTVKHAAIMKKVKKIKKEINKQKTEQFTFHISEYLKIFLNLSFKIFMSSSLSLS